MTSSRATGAIAGTAPRSARQPAAGLPRADAIPAATSHADRIDAASRRTLWVSQLYTGMVGFLGAGSAGLFYVFRTWDSGPQRGWLAVVGVVAIVQSMVVWACRRYFVTDVQRARLFLGWNVLSFGLVALATVLDGGIASPIALAWVLPTIYLLMGFSRAGIVFCGSVAIALYLLVAQLTPGPLNFPAFVMQVVVLADAVFMVLLAAIAREQREGVLAAVRAQLSVLATTDSLTGCLNQPEFTRIACSEVARAARCGYPVSLLAIDVDHFKSINDTHGHLVGDEVLRELGAMLRVTVRRTDTVGRLGGDELAVLCPEAGLADARELAGRLREAARELSIGLPVTLSIGISVLGEDEIEPRRLRERADRALYDAKRHGRDRSVVCGPAPA